MYYILLCISFWTAQHGGALTHHPDTCHSIPFNHLCSRNATHLVVLHSVQHISYYKAWKKQDNFQKCCWNMYYFYYTNYVTRISKKNNFTIQTHCSKHLLYNKQNTVCATHLVFLPQQYQNIHHCTFAQEHRNRARWTGSHKVLCMYYMLPKILIYQKIICMYY